MVLPDQAMSHLEQDIKQNTTPCKSSQNSRDLRDIVIDLEKTDAKDSSDSEYNASLRSGSAENTVVPSTTAPGDEENPPPDGGLMAWLQVLGGHIVIFATWGYINTFGIFQRYYLDYIPNTNQSAISWIGSIQVFLIFSLGTFTGRAFDAGYHRSIYTTGSLFIVLGIFLNSIATKYYQVFLTHGLLVGLGNGMLFAPTIALTSTYFRKKRSLAVGVVACGTVTGGVTIPLLVANLLPKLGFGKTMRTVAGMVLGLLLLSGVILRPRLKPRKTGGLIDKEALKDIPYVLFMLGSVFVFMGLYIPTYYLPTYASFFFDKSSKVPSYLVVMMNGIGVLGRVGPNYLADVLIGPYNMIIPFAFLSAIFQFMWIGISNTAGLYLFAAFYGVFCSGLQSLFPAVLTSFSSKDPTKTGVRVGMVFTVVGFACLVGNPIGGALVEKKGGLRAGREGLLYAQVFAGVVTIFGALLLTLGRFAAARGKFWQKI